MNKSKSQKKSFLFIAALVIVLVQIIPYIIAQIIVVAFGLKTHDLTLPVDLNIPFVPAFIVIYLGCFAYWVIEYMIVSRDADIYAKYLTASFVGSLLCFLLFLAYPVGMARPEIPQIGFFALIMKITYGADRPVNLFPSMHCFASWICFISNRSKTAASKTHVAISFFMTVLICLSTLFVKQHIILDVVAGIVLAELSYALARIKGFSNSAKKFHRILESHY